MLDRPGLASQEHAGVWWLPSEPGRTVGGRLTFAPAEGLRLDLIGVLGGGRPGVRHDIVLGTTVDGEPITLESAAQGGRREVSSVWLPAPVVAEVLLPQHAYIGAHLPLPDQRRFASGIIELDDLADWMEAWPFKDEYGPHPVVFAVSYAHPEEIRAPFDLGEIIISPSAREFGDGIRERGIRASVAFVVRLKEAQPIVWWLQQIVRPLQNLLTFVGDRPSSVTRFALLQLERNIDVLYQPSGPDRAGRRLYSHEFLFHPREVAERMPTMLAKWFELATELAPVIDSFIGMRYRPVFAENRFLNVVGALEAYHRRRYPNTVIPSSEHRVRRKRILSRAPEEDRDWLGERLCYSNEPSLRMRLADLLVRPKDAYLPSILGSNELIGPTVDLRNRLIHQDPRRSARAVNPFDLWVLTERLTLLLLACLLDELGISGSQLRDVIVRSVRFRQLSEAGMP